MELQLKVFRFHPEKDLRPHYDLFSLEAEATDRVLDLLEMVRAEHDPPLACLLYTSDAADDLPCVDLGGRRLHHN